MSTEAGTGDIAKFMNSVHRLTDSLAAHFVFLVLVSSVFLSRCSLPVRHILKLQSDVICFVLEMDFKTSCLL